jgi:hypothetical protein
MAPTLRARIQTLTDLSNCSWWRPSIAERRVWVAECSHRAEVKRAQVQDIYRTDNLTRQRRYDDCCFAVACEYRTFHCYASDRTVRKLSLPSRQPTHY